MKLYNNQPEYGEAGPWECESDEQLANDMVPSFTMWAAAEWLQDDETTEDRETFINRRIDEMRDEFLGGLCEVYDDGQHAPWQRARN